MPEMVVPASIRRRLAVMLYESLLLFGVLFIAGWIFGTLLQQRHALYLRQGLQYWLFIVMGTYFVWFWSHGGQTLAMKTWRVRLVSVNGAPVSTARSMARYVLCWLWFIPGLLLAKLLGVHGWLLVAIPAANLLIWAALARLDSQRQFVHDRIVGTRLIQFSLRDKQAVDRPDTTNLPL